MKKAIPAYTNHPAPEMVPRIELIAIKSLLSAERRRHAAVERALTDLIETLRQQCTDLRVLYFENLKITAGPR